MNALILAAGRGTRIESATHGRPKCLLTFGERTILDYQIEGLRAAGVAQIGIVIGHNGGQIVDHINRNYVHCRSMFHIVPNPWFATTNNIYSLWLAREWLANQNFMCLNADVLCHPDILLPAAMPVAPVSMIVDPEWRDETMKVIIRDGRVVRMSKAITRSEYSATYMGITTFSRTILPALFREIGTMLDDGLVNEFFNSAVQRLVGHGLCVGYTPTLGLPWAEIDDPADLHYAQTSVEPLLSEVFRGRLKRQAPIPAVA